jgi:putative component of membrane protein insertase Oxa1/YidC/SpoIIIJ protein YidD
MENPDLNGKESAQVRDYCLNHSLNRPDTDFKTGLKWFVGLELLTITFTFGVEFLFGEFGFSVSFYPLYSLISVIVFCFALKKVCIVTIEIYQHYASEEVRRRCTLMPSCSEYALLALHKYNVIKALCKIIIRLGNRCNGIYKIDYP